MAVGDLPNVLNIRSPALNVFVLDPASVTSRSRLSRDIDISFVPANDVGTPSAGASGKCAPPPTLSGVLLISDVSVSSMGDSWLASAAGIA